MFHLGWFSFESIPGWSDREFDPSYPWASPALFQDMARKLEAAHFDFVLLEDASAVPDDYAGNSEIYLSSALGAPKFDPAVIATYIADATSRIGIIPTFTTSFYPPYLLARLMATQSLMSGGRIGWNVVTSSSELAAKNFGYEALPEHDARYDIADEYLDLCTQLWNSWESDAVVANAESGVFADSSKVHRVDFKGTHYSCRGPLNVPRPSGGRPVIAQAGNSPRGKAFAAKHADIVLTPVLYPPAVKAFRDEIRSLAAEEGRCPDDIKVMPLAFPKIFETEADVTAYRASLQHVPERTVKNWLALISSITTLDLSQYALDEPLPSHVQTNGSRGTLDWLRSGGATLRQMALRMARLTPDEPLIGTPDKVAQEMEEIMSAIGGDGFLIGGALTPTYVEKITSLLVPALRRRGLVRTDYVSSNFKDNLLAF